MMTKQSTPIKNAAICILLTLNIVCYHFPLKTIVSGVSITQTDMLQLNAINKSSTMEIVDTTDQLSKSEADNRLKAMLDRARGGVK
jgi:hypothetical protein